ncbi:hypothetical protein JY96_15075 [Aquabacterium sp. NJ1]|uniref:DUF748 domain-containing protein n=1 Tax=Aquabacterium sp. NJ1 TaxID=1538295 RepID=UPI00052E245B|nr:DUF748 domain-containing protein [Aquabacterium sp. NJ1]KGM40922.1 hypothetical protein JY96_15075 [Aquabacterium sp. NJ1]
MTVASSSDSAAGPLSRWRRPLAVVAGLAALWTVVPGMWLPGWIRPQIEKSASEALGTPVAVQAVQIHPWTGVVALDGLAIGPAAAPMLRVQHVEAQLSLESIWRFAPVLRRVSVLKPDVWVERQSADRFNFSAVLDKLTAEPKTPKPESEPAHFAVFNIELHDGLIRYTDRVLNQEHRIDQLHIGVPFVSNLPSFINVDVKPQLSARVDGSPLSIKGDTLPFAEGLRSAVHVKWDGVDVPHWLAAAQPFMPQPWQMQASDGRLDADLTLKFEERKPPAVPKLSIEGGLKLNKLALNLPHAPALGLVDAGWQSLEIQGLDAQPLERQVKLGAVLLDGVNWRSRPVAAAALTGQAKPDASQRQAALPKAASAPVPASSASPALAKTAASADKATPWAWSLGKLRIGVARLDIQTESQQAWPAIEQVRVQVDDLSSQASAKPAAWQLALRDEHDASLLAQGHVQAAKQWVDAQLNLSKVQIAPWLAPVAEALPLPLRIEQGQLGVQAQLSARLLAGSALEPAEVRLLSGRVSLNQLDARAAQKGREKGQGKGQEKGREKGKAAQVGQALADHVRLDDLALDGIQAQLDLSAAPALRTLAMDKLSISKLDAAITRGPRGEWMGMAPPAADQPGQAAPSRPSTKAVANTTPAPRITLAALQCSACQFQFKDQTVTPAAQFETHQTSLQLADLGNDLSRPISLELDTLAQGKGRLQLKGSVKPQPLLVDARVKVAGLDLRAVQPYIDPLVNITLAGAKAQADGQLNLQIPPKGNLQARYKGRMGLSDVRVLDRVNDADFLSWQNLSLDGTDLALNGDAVDANLGRIALKDFYGRLIINPSGQLNVAGIMRHEAGAQARSLTTPEPAASAPAAKPAASPAPTPAASQAQPVATASAKPTPKLRWQQILLSKGRVDFTDNFIKPNYSARLTQIEGDVSAVSSTKPEPATVKISGAVDDAAPLSITGQLHPLGPKLYTDIQGSAKGIELTRLTPYASRYAGYAIEKGTLSVNVHYKIDGGKLEASNQVFLDQLTFGEKTDSPEATKLPVLFAVSLLKNSRGEIDVNLPISGSLDDPEFSVGGIIWRVIVNLITKAVTAPFALLSGGGSDELGYVAFDAGQADLSAKAQQALNTLATKLADRPALKLQATGRADPAVDVEGLRKLHVETLMRAAKAKSTGQAISEVQIAPEERSTWLAAAYKAADIKKPRNLIGLAKTLPDSEMEALLKNAAAVGPEALRTLANQRGDQVKAYLSRKLPPERVLLTASKVGNEGLADDKGPSTRVQFEIK